MINQVLPGMDIQENFTIRSFCLSISFSTELLQNVVTLVNNPSATHFSIIWY